MQLFDGPFDSDIIMKKSANRYEGNCFVIQPKIRALLTSLSPAVLGWPL